MKLDKTALFFLRLPVAISLLGHGLVRLPKLATFANWMVSSMEKSPFPPPFLLAFGYLVPFAEFIIGLTLLSGFKTKLSTYAGLTLMSIFILGSCAIENWSAVEAQLVHGIFLGGYLVLYTANKQEKL